MIKTLFRRWWMLLALPSLLQFGGCLSRGVSREFLLDGVRQAGLEFLLDNDAEFDLFAD